MPFALMHAATGELLSSLQLNGYHMTYYGIMLWDDEPNAEARMAALAKAERYRPDGPAEGSAAGASGTGGAGARRDRHVAEWEQVQELARWKPVLLGEQEAKLANVRLRNDPGLRVFLRGGRIEAEPARTAP